MKSIFQSKAGRMYLISNIIVSLLCINFVVLNKSIYYPKARENVPIALNDTTEVESGKNIKTGVVKKTISKTSQKYAPGEYDPILGNEIVEYAETFFGLRYVSGGNSLTTGTDCSGFTKLIYGHYGIKLSRGVQSQAKNGNYVRKSDLKPGDLVFYGYDDGIVHHVAIYIGNNKVIHESNYKYGVKYSNLNILEYITAKRVIIKKENIAVSTPNEYTASEYTNSEYKNTYTTNEYTNNEYVKTANEY